MRLECQAAMSAERAGPCFGYAVRGGQLQQWGGGGGGASVSDDCRVQSGHRTLLYRVQLCMPCDCTGGFTVEIETRHEDFNDRFSVVISVLS